MTIELPGFDATKYFTDAEGQAELLADASESGDARYIKHALDTVARALGMTSVEAETGMKRQAIYRALGENGKPDARHAAQGRRSAWLSPAH
jgi:probable addiction module antidote protein